MESKTVRGKSLNDLYSQLKIYLDKGWVKIGKAEICGGSREVRCQIIRESNYGK